MKDLQKNQEGNYMPPIIVIGSLNREQVYEIHEALKIIVVAMRSRYLGHKAYLSNQDTLKYYIGEFGKRLKK